MRGIVVVMATSSHPFAELVERRQIGQVVLGIERIIVGSFLVDRSRMTQAEAQRRTAICVDLFGQLRRDMQWSVERILHALPRALRARLDGLPWSPENERAVWAPEAPTIST